LIEDLFGKVDGQEVISPPWHSTPERWEFKVTEIAVVRGAGHGHVIRRATDVHHYGIHRCRAEQGWEKGK
jgi:hypothetical protein